MDFIKAIKMVYERDAVIKRESKDYCIYKNERTDRLRRLSFNKTGGVIHENYSLLSDAESLVRGKLPISKLPKKRLTYALVLDKE